MIARTHIGTAFGVAILAAMSPALAGNNPDNEAGATAYQRCAACHLEDGSGVPGSFPPIAGRLGPLANSDEGRTYLTMVVKAGLTGPIEVAETTYRGFMPGQGGAFDDAQIAAVLNHLLEELNGDALTDQWQRFSAAEVLEITARHPDANGRSVHGLRAAALRAAAAR